MEEQKIKELKKEIRAREQAEQLAKGFKGKGYKGNFKTYCKGCQTEYHHEAVATCNNCGLETVSHEVSAGTVFPIGRKLGGTFQKSPDFSQSEALI